MKLLCSSRTVAGAPGWAGGPEPSCLLHPRRCSKASKWALERVIQKRSLNPVRARGPGRPPPRRKTHGLYDQGPLFLKTNQQEENRRVQPHRPGHLALATRVQYTGFLLHLTTPERAPETSGSAGDGAWAGEEKQGLWHGFEASKGSLRTRMTGAGTVRSSC